METPRFPKRPGDGPIDIKQVTRAAGSATIVVEATGDHGLNLSGHGRVRIAGVSGFATANGDWRVGSFTEPMAVGASTTKFTLVDRFSGVQGDGTSGNGDAGQQVGTGGKLQRWDDTNGNGQTSNVALVVDPTSSDIVYLAGDHDSDYAEDKDGRPPGQGQAANIVRGNATVTGDDLGQIPTKQWTFITGTGTSSSTTPHGDVRDMAFNAKNELILSSDGGIFLHPSPRGIADWVNLNGDMNGLETHDVAFDPLAKVLIASTQDNGVPEQPAPGVTGPWTVPQLPGGTNSLNGDGGDVQAAVETSDPTKSIRIVSGQQFSSVMIREFQKVGTQVTQISGPTYLPLKVASSDGGAPKTIREVDSFQFITPFLLNARNTNRLIIAGGANVWESTDLGQTVAIVPGGPGSGLGFAYGNPSNEDALWVAAEAAASTFVRAGAPLKQVPGFQGTAWAVVMTPTNPASAYVTSDQHVYFMPDATATDGGVAWTDVTGDLSTVGNGEGPGELRALVYVQSQTTGDRIVVAAANATTASGPETGVPGVFMMAVANPGVWTRIGSNLPNASAYDLVYDAPNDRLYVATAGSGVWSVSGIRQLDRAPIARCRPVPVNADGTCHATVAASAVDNGSADPDGGGVTLSLAPAGPFGPGATPVTLTVTDSQGASATCQTTVTVTDRTLPVIGTAANVTRTLCDPDGAPLTLTPPAASDNCGSPTVTGTVIASSDPRFPVPTSFTGTVTLGAGTFTVRWTARTERTAALPRRR